MAMFFTQIYIIYTKTTTLKIFTWSYIKKVQKNVYVFLIKLSAATKQLIRRNSIGCLKNQAIFFTG